MNPQRPTVVHVRTRAGDDIYFDGGDTFNFAGVETQSVKRVIAMRDGLTELLQLIKHEKDGNNEKEPE